MKSKISFLSAAANMLFAAVLAVSMQSCLFSENPVEKPVEPPVALPLFSWESQAGEATIVGGTIECTAPERVNYLNTVNEVQYYTICLNGKKDFSTDYTTITLDKALAGGEKMIVTAYRNKDVADKTSGLLAKFDVGEATVASETGLEFVNMNPAGSADSNFGTEPNTVEFTIPAEAAGSKTITMTRSHTGTNLFITKFVIEK